MGASITIFIAICCIFVTALACLPEGPQECDTLVNCIKSANYEMQTTCKQQVQQIDLQPVENTAYSQCSKSIDKFCHTSRREAIFGFSGHSFQGFK